MARRKIKWKFGFLFFVLLLNVFTKSLPIEKSESILPNIVTTDTYFGDLVLPNLVENENNKPGSLEKSSTAAQTSNEENSTDIDDALSTSSTEENSAVNDDDTADTPETRPSNETVTTNNEGKISTGTTTLARTDLLRQIRPGQDAREYTVHITIDGDNFHGRVVIDVRLDSATRDDPILFHAKDMNINSVLVGVFTEASAIPVDFDHDDDDGILEIDPDRGMTSYIVVIEYTAAIRNDGTGIFQGDFNGQSYLGMNLYPTNARRVFPCVDELTDFSTVKFTFENVPFTNMIANSLPENDATDFHALQGPMHLWGMVAHNFPTVMIPVTNVLLMGRPGLNQDGQASLAMQNFFLAFNEWTDKPYFEIIANQHDRLAVIALPDTDVDWYALSTVCIWEPYIYMETGHSINQRKIGLPKLAEALARQWFGYVIYPMSWADQWVFTGLQKYSAFDIVRDFQTDPMGADVTLLDMDTIFVTDMIQESLLRDAYSTAQILQPDNDDLEAEEHIRDHINGLINIKAPVIFNMIRIILGDGDDYIQKTAQILLSRTSLEPIQALDFYGALSSAMPDDSMIDDIEEYMEPWITAKGYPVLQVNIRRPQGAVQLSQIHFGFTQPGQETFQIPITYTTSMDMDFSNIRPIEMMTTSAMNLPLVALGEEDFVLFNIQGRGYYRVDYDNEMWEVIIEALEDPERREEIHPLNRATLVDDALNLARAGMLDYDIAFRVVLAMEHETEYAPWKAFVRNMNFLRKRLVALVLDDEDLDPDIYLRMVRRTIGTFEDEIGFYPEVNVLEPAMVSLTRGLVMDHACRANYAPCIAAAIDWFYNDDGNVNPDIPKDIRPAVYCTMVREGDAQVINALYDRLEIEPSHYERVVILESLACSQDEGFISQLLGETIDPGSPYGVEERSRILKAVAESGYEGARMAIQFMSMRTIEIRDMYGGPKKLEELLFVIAENAADDDLVFDLSVYINSINSNLLESIDAAERARDQAEEDLRWNTLHMDLVYEWIDENDAPKMFLSIALLSITLLVTLFNH